MATVLKSTWSRAAKAAYIVALLAAVAVLAMRVRNGVEPGMLALVDSSLDEELQSVAATSGANARVVLEGTNWADVVRGAGAVREVFGIKSSGVDVLNDVRGRTHGLIDSTSRELILSNDTAAVREAAEARLFGIAPPLFSLKEDPMLLATAYVESLQDVFAPGWSFRDGLPTKSVDGREYALVSIRLAQSGGARFVAAAMDALPGKLPDGVEAHFSGAAFHAARCASGAEREIGILSAISIALVLLFGWMLFRSVSFAVPLAAALCAGGLFAAGVLFAVYPRPHVLAFVFGTSLIGLSVDYVYHARSAGGAKMVARPLTQSFATTMVCFLPLLFADVVVLRQMALFTMAGLLAVYAGVMVFGWGGTLGNVEMEKCGNGKMVKWRNGRFGLVKGIRLALLLAAAAGIAFLRTSVDPAVFYRPDGKLSADEKKVAQLLSMNGAKIVFTRGATLQEALEREEEAGVENGLSKIIPSLKRQRENVGLIERLYAKEGKAYEEHTGIKVKGRQQAYNSKNPDEGGHRSEATLLDPKRLPEGSVIGAIARTLWTGRGLISVAKQQAHSSQHQRIIDMRETMEGIFAKASHSTWRLFGISAAALFVFLVLVFRRRIFVFAVPVASALMATAGMLGWLGIPFTFFTLLSFFVILGLGLDYAIFHRGALGAVRPAMRRTVFFAFLTSLAGLGLLALTAFPVTRDMGITFAFGLLFAYLFSIK